MPIYDAFQKGCEPGTLWDLSPKSTDESRIDLDEVPSPNGSSFANEPRMEKACHLLGESIESSSLF